MSNVRIQVEPLAAWPYAETGPGARVFSPFSAKYSLTLDELDRELFHLGAHRHGVAALQVVTAERNLRRDGLLRSGAKIDHPGVALSFTADEAGPLTFFCDRFVARGTGLHWQHNLRAIVLTLEKLRAVDRYGAVGSGQQYAGFRQIEAPSVSQSAARARLAEIGEARPEVTSDRELVREARKRSHPDQHIGSEALWHEVDTLARVLGVA